MKLETVGLTVIACAALAALPQAQGIGTRMPGVELEGYSNTPAKSYDEFLGRAVLIEFFAFW
jgi:hypothetical protein